MAIHVLGIRVHLKLLGKSMQPRKLGPRPPFGVLKPSLVPQHIRVPQLSMAPHSSTVPRSTMVPQPTMVLQPSKVLLNTKEPQLTQVPLPLLQVHQTGYQKGKDLPFETC